MISFASWIKQPSKWLPSSTRAMMLAVFIILAGSTSIHSANAQSTGSCTQSNGNTVVNTFQLPCDQDLYKNMLETIFPEVTPLGDPAIVEGATHTNGNSALANAFMAFLSVLMAVSAALLAFHIVSTMVSWANEGQIMGQRWSVVWSPMRLFMGVGALTPFIKGYCIAQVAVLYVALWGGSLANIMWSAYVTGLENPTISASSIPNLQPVLSNLAEGRLCWAILNRERNVIQATGGNSANFADLPTSVDSAVPYTTGSYNAATNYNGNFKNLWNLNASKTFFGDTNETVNYTGNRWDFGPSCGNVTFDVISNQTKLTNFDQARLNALNTYVADIGKSMDDAVSKLESPGLGGGGSVGNTASPGDASTIVNNIRSSLGTEVPKVVQAWGTAINNLVSASQSDQSAASQFQSNATQYGWVTAAIYYMNVSRMQSMADDIIASLPVKINPGESNPNAMGSVSHVIDSNLGKDMAGQLFNQVESFFGGKDANPTACDGNAESNPQCAAYVSKQLSNASAVGSIKGVTINTNLIANGQNADSTLSSIFNFIGSACKGLFDSVGGDSTSSGASASSVLMGSELQKMTEFGSNLILIGGTILGSIGLISTVGWFASLGGAAIGVATLDPVAVGASLAAGKIVGSLAKYLTPVALFLMLVGIVHAYVLPMIPYIHFTMFILSMIIFVVEAMIAAPLWAFVHIRLDGQEFVDQRQSTGYMLMFNLFLRAPLAMFGYFLSFAVFNAIVYFLAITFYPAVASTTGYNSGSSSGGAGFVGTLVMLGMLAFLHYTLALRSFALMGEIPNRVSKWFGANAGDQGEHHLAERAIQFASGVVAGRIQGGLAQGVGAFAGGGRGRGGAGGKENELLAAAQTARGQAGGGGTGGGSSSGGVSASSGWNHARESQIVDGASGAEVSGNTPEQNRGVASHLMNGIRNEVSSNREKMGQGSFKDNAMREAQNHLQNYLNNDENNVGNRDPRQYSNMLNSIREGLPENIEDMTR